MGIDRSFRLRMGAVALATAVWGMASATQAQAASIAYVHSGALTIDYVANAGNTVAYLEDPVGLTGSALSGYDAVIVASNMTFTDSSAIGNALKTYADAGGRVIITQFSFDPSWALTGGISDPGYSPFTPGPSGDSYPDGDLSLGTIHLPGHPLLNGALSATSEFQHNAGVDPGATLVASWASGRPAVAYNDLPGGGIVIGLNLFPADPYADAGGRQLVLNALGFEGTVATPEPATAALFSLGLAALLAARRRETAQIQAR